MGVSGPVELPALYVTFSYYSEGEGVGENCNRRTNRVTFLVTALLLLMMTPGAKAAARCSRAFGSGSAVEIGGSGLLLDATAM